MKLVYYEAYDRIDDAFYREKQVQGWTHAKKKALIEKNFSAVHKLAECQNESHFQNDGIDPVGFGSAQPAEGAQPEGE